MIGGPHVYCLRRWHLGDCVRRDRPVPDGPLGDRDLPRHPLASPARLVDLGPTEEMGGGRRGPATARPSGPGEFGRISPVKSASCLALAYSPTAYNPLRTRGMPMKNGGHAPHCLSKRLEHRRLNPRSSGQMPESPLHSPPQLPASPAAPPCYRVCVSVCGRPPGVTERRVCGDHDQGEASRSIDRCLPQTNIENGVSSK